MTAMALANPGQSFVVPAGINYFEEDPNPMQPGDQWGGPGQLSFEADSANGPIHGSFSAVLQAVQPNMGASINISALFCAIATP